MPRNKGWNRRAVNLAASLENVQAMLVQWEYIEPITRLRIEQACARSGLRDLLEPALNEMDEMTGSVSSAKRHISQALRQLAGSDDGADN